MRQPFVIEMNMIRFRILPLAVALFVAVACGGAKDDPEPAPEPPVGQGNVEIIDPPASADGWSERFTVRFFSEEDWTLTADADWIAIRQRRGEGDASSIQSVEVVADRNYGAARSAVLTFETESGKNSFTVSQNRVVKEDVAKGDAEYRVTKPLLDAMREQNGHSGSRIMFCAHRGNTYTGKNVLQLPDNSLAGIAMAIRKGVEFVEIDVRTTKDGVMVLCHDRSINSTTTGFGNVDELTLTEIRRFDMKRSTKVYYGQKVPELLDVLKLCKGRAYVNIDIAPKGDSDVAEPVDIVKMVDMIRQTDMTDQVMIYGAWALQKVSETEPRIALHPYMGSIAAWSGYPVNLVQIHQSWYSGSAPNAYIADYIHAQGYTCLSNMLNYDADFLAGNTSYVDKFIAAKVDVMQTDYAEKMAEYLRGKGLR